MSDMYSRRSFPAQSLLRCTHQPVWFAVVWGKEVSLVFFIVLFFFKQGSLYEAEDGLKL